MKRTTRLPARAGMALWFFLAACAIQPAPQKLSLSPVEYSDLPGWNDDHSVEAIPAFMRSCGVIARIPPEDSLGVGGKARDWQSACAALTAQPPQNDEAARAFFGQWFQPYAAAGNAGEDGLFTGYYEADLRGSLQQHGAYQTPLYARPDDLIDVDLGAFKSDLRGQRIEGKVAGHKLEPYDDRAEIERGSLAGRAPVLLWVDDPVDAFFLAIQGSGRVHMDDGSVRQVGYDDVNGRAYVAIGRALADMNLLDRPVTMQAIRAWLKNNPDRAQAIMNLNPSYVFFRAIEGDGPVGSEGVALTPERSLAVDPEFIPLGAPLWLDIEGPYADSQEPGNIRRLVIAQDTGGAIKGPVRGDFFWGYGPEAEARAGAMQNTGRYYLLLPKQADQDSGAGARN